MTENRREFLKRLGKGAAYAAPVVYTLARPRDLHAIVVSGRWTVPQNSQTTTSASERIVDPPWAADPPWAKPPPRTREESTGDD